MQEFFTLSITKAAADLGICEGKVLLEKRETPANTNALLTVYSIVGGLMCDAALHGFTSTGSHCQRIMELLKNRSMALSCGELMDALKSLRERLEDDLKNECFLHLDTKERAMYHEPLNHWDEVISRFPKVRYNIEESSKCFALDRYGASVFHVLLVAEYGVIKIADLMQVLGDKPGWGSVQRLQNLMKIPFEQRTDLVQKHSKFLNDVVPLAMVVKDSWRHKLDHVDNQLKWIATDFSPNVAEEIISATRGFIEEIGAGIAAIEKAASVS